MPLSYGTGNNIQLYKTQDGIVNNIPYAGSAVTASGNTLQMTAYQYYNDTTLSTIRDWYQYTGGSTGSSSISTYLMYKPDCLLVNKGAAFGGWQFIDNISTKVQKFGDQYFRITRQRITCQVHSLPMLVQSMLHSGHQQPQCMWLLVT